MRLDFFILWVDDLPDSLTSSLEPLDRKMRNQGFKLRVEWAKSVAEAKGKLSQSVLRDNIDLILVDYDLGQGPNGDVALREIRDQLQYREMIFYSAKPQTELKELASKQGVEGIYFATRIESNLVDTAFGVFETLIKKVLDIDHTRGIVMGASSDIEHVVHDALLVLYAKHDEKGQEALKKGVLKEIEDKLTGYRKISDAAVKAGTIEALLELRDLLNAHTKLCILADVLEERLGKSHEMRKKVRAYTFDILPQRNKLAHVTVATNADGQRILRGKDGTELDEDKLRTLRRELLDHRENFHALTAFLQQ